MRTWLHCAHLRMGGEKMAKSTGNIARVDELVANGVSPRALRYALISVHYRASLNFSDESLAAAGAAVERIDAVLAALAAYREARDDDPALPGVLATMRDGLRGRRSTTTSTCRPRSPRCSTASASSTAGSTSGPLSTDDAARAAAAIRDLDRVLGVAAPEEPSLDPELEALLDARAAARASRDWAESDRLRDELLARGVAVEDTRDGQRWRLLVTSGG